MVFCYAVRMTTFVLIGGYPYKAADGGRKLSETLVGDSSAPWRILMCYFARPQGEWDARFQKDREAIATHLPKKKIDFQKASFENFAQQVDWAQTIYFSGGDLEQEFQTFLQHSDWRKYIDRKTVAGSSAGADVLARYYYLLDSPGIAEGLGVLPIKVIPHFKSDYNAPNIDWDKAYAELKAHGEDLPLYALREGQFQVIEV